MTADRPEDTGASTAARWQLSVERVGDDAALVRQAGSWKLQDHLPDPAAVEQQIPPGSPIRRVAFDAKGITAWDTGLLAYVSKLCEWAAGKSIEVDLAGLPDGIRRLLKLAAAVPRQQTGAETARLSWLARVGTATIATWQAVRSTITFVGEVALALAAFLRGKARFQGSELAIHIQACGAQALSIVTLISCLVGVILAFIGAIQLRQFGAQIYVADLVGIAMSQQMGALMVAIIMSGRSGAAFAAQIGTMQGSEEVDALQTMGLSPVEFLVLPRLLALMLMIPFLTVYADLLGILGGGFVGVTMLKLSPTEYWVETKSALVLADFAKGLINGEVFGTLVGLAGCLRGMQCGRSSAAVGLAVTSAVVTGIVWIVCSDAILTVIYNVL
ncbi:MAG TPA: ABC transporter permease, partial [Candidatus Methylomirabilis sp.]